MANIREQFDNLHYGISSLAIFRGLLKDPVISPLYRLLRELAENGGFDPCTYSEFVSELYRKNDDLGKYILKAVSEDENFYIAGKAKGKNFSDNIENALKCELELLEQLADLTTDSVLFSCYRSYNMPRWSNTHFDFVTEYRQRIENIGLYGYGHFAKNTMFILQNGNTVPVSFPDTQKLADLYGYQRERQAVIDNTFALIKGRKAQNALLYGDAGTGKSSTVKAVVNEFADKGLRLVEITKEQLRDIPMLIDKLSSNPLKFIIFIDDLTFTAGEDCFGALKAALEGSVSARAENIAIYATSNRRHLVKESFSDREGDDVHRNDTMQELLSLSARFGLRVNFSRPDKKNYTAIAAELAKAHGIALPEEEIALKAEQFAISSGNGRSPRTARQFINQLINESER